LFSLFSSFDGDRQSGSFVIERNRDRLSTRKFDAGVFTQAGPIADIVARQDLVPRYHLQTARIISDIALETSRQPTTSKK
jgi:hypothetical protein